MVTATFSFLNLSAQAALSATLPMVVSEITHSTGVPSGYFNVLEISAATLFAIFIVWSSRDSRTPFILPSIVGRIPIFGHSP